MNTYVKAIVRPSFWHRISITKQQITVIWLMGILLMFSALGVVFAKDNYRRLYNDFQIAHQDAVEMQEENNRLLLETSTWLAQSRLVSQARTMGMVVPNDKQTVWLAGKKSNN